MSRAYKVSIQEAQTREIKAGDEICSQIELLPILPPEEMEYLLRCELAQHGFQEAEGTMQRTTGTVLVAIDPCSGVIRVKAQIQKSLALLVEKTGEVYDRVEEAARMRLSLVEKARDEIEHQAEEQRKSFQLDATEKLESHLHELRPEIDQIANRVMTQALQKKAATLGTIKAISEDNNTGTMTITIEV